MTWLTNNPTVARKLRAADYIYDTDKIAASRLPLVEKIRAIREAKARRDAAYAAAEEAGT